MILHCLSSRDALLLPFPAALPSAKTQQKLLQLQWVSSLVYFDERFNVSSKTSPFMLHSGISGLEVRGSFAPQCQSHGGVLCFAWDVFATWVSAYHAR